MACPTCSHTMARLTGHDDMIFWHCERCGTVKVSILQPGYEPRFYVPKLVERCRQFARGLGTDDASGRAAWHRLGIAESINRPEDRP